ncbi:MAG: helix-turn-helix domain-containing protein [Planctomycetota bacterium]|jgi:hypothetical protein|nr:helix-turn-helix domain-containing protein [Planctomycetota bacterium]MDP6940870.1 helix-turn-helix domain-containing protein [Planctomycetota bacterium]
MPEAQKTLDRLQTLGLTNHQARTYVALLGLGESGATEVARVALLPRPNTYDALNALTARGACTLLPGRPRKYRPSPPKEWLIPLGKNLLEEAEGAAEALSQVETLVSTSTQMHGWQPIAAQLKQGLQIAQEHLLIDAPHSSLSRWEGPIRATSRRGVEVAILCRGGILPFQPLSGWVVLETEELGSSESCWVVDQEWALRYSGTGKAARGRCLLDSAFSAELGRGILGQISMLGDWESSSPHYRALRRLYSEATRS